MIIGIGSDFVSVERIAKVWQRHPENFLARVYTPAERDYATVQPSQTVRRLAKRFAAKEAVAKALGTGLGEYAFFNEIEVIQTVNKKPEITLSGRAKAYLENLVGKEKRTKIHITLTDDGDFALAFAVIEAI